MGPYVNCLVVEHEEGFPSQVVGGVIDPVASFQTRPNLLKLGCLIDVTDIGVFSLTFWGIVLI